jgi:hypothetical protein
MFLTDYPIGKLPIDKAEIGITIASMAGESRWLSERALKQGSFLASELTLREEGETGGWTLTEGCLVMMPTFPRDGATLKGAAGRTGGYSSM